MRVVAIVALLSLGIASCGAESNGGAREGESGDRARTTAAVANTAPTTREPAVSAPPPSGDSAMIERVLDGDSFLVVVDGTEAEVRLAGINAPEADECYGDAARDILRTMAGDEVVLVAIAGVDDRDQFGRLLRNVWIGGSWLNLAMVEAGAALTLQTGSADEPALVAAEDLAWEGGLGMWSTQACGSFPDGVRITDIRFDPPGRDFENAAEEFVLLANEGDDPIDLSGWILRDESSTHRFIFPSGVELDAGEGLRVRSGCGEDAGRDLHWCADDAVWSNGGDTVILQTEAGTVVDRWKYPGDY